MGGRHYSDLIVVGLIGVVGTFIVLYAAEFVVQQNIWCSTSDEHCVRAWLSALGGWAAAFVAGGTGAIIFGQFREARRQTAFMLGDGQPSVELFPSSSSESLRDFFALELEVTNWNRRALVVETVAVRIDGKPAAVTYRMKGERMDQLWSDRIMFEHLPGWKDRNGPPATRTWLISAGLSGVVDATVTMTLADTPHRTFAVAVRSTTAADRYQRVFGD